jgi:GNAT superfamily N-acetyltransferase
MNIRNMTAADIPVAMRLKSQNNWNQLEADWKRQLDLEPDGCFVFASNGQPVGTACACVFGDVAWINFVLVDQAHRGKGIGSALMKHVVQYLDERRVATIRLDATPLGQPVYEKLGFVGEFTLERYEGFLPKKDADLKLPGSSRSGRVAPIASSDLPAVFDYDEAVSATRRDKLLRHVFESGPDNALMYAPDSNLKGFCMFRPGSNAWQIGPLQGSVGAGLHLLSLVKRRLAGQRVYIDVPKSHEVAVIVAQSLGLNLQRSFLRMSRGKSVADREHLHLFWSSFGPEKG